jgi:thioredoxin reductase (NADPH)
MLRAVKSLQEELFKNKKVEICLNSVLEEIAGDKFIESVKIKDVTSGNVKQIDVRGVFIFIGQEPNTGAFRDLLDVDEKGFIKTDADMKTSQDGVFAAGDARAKKLRQVITASADGAVAAHSAELYVRKLKGEEYK